MATPSRFAFGSEIPKKHACLKLMFSLCTTQGESITTTGDSMHPPCTQHPVTPPTTQHQVTSPTTQHQVTAPTTQLNTR